MPEWLIVAAKEYSFVNEIESFKAFEFNGTDNFLSQCTFWESLERLPSENLNRLSCKINIIPQDTMLLSFVQTVGRSHTGQKRQLGPDKLSA